MRVCMRADMCAFLCVCVCVRVRARIIFSAASNFTLHAKAHGSCASRYISLCHAISSFLVAMYQAAL